MLALLSPKGAGPVRALFSLLPARGSLQPLLPVAQAMRARGHQVALCSAPRLRGEVEAHGLAFLPAGLDWHVSDPDYIEVLCRAAGGLAFPALAGQERFAWVIANLFIGAAARRMLPGLTGLARQWRADLIVRESLEFAGCAAAEALGLPHASVAAAADSALDRRRDLAGPLAGLRQQAGLSADPDGDMVYRYLHLCFTPPGFDGPGARFPPTARFFAHRSTPTPGDGLPPWLDHLAPRPTVLVSMGTVFHRTPGLHETILAALRDEPVNLLIALGFDQDPARLGPLPCHVRAQPTLPQIALLPQCALLVTHGGFNSVKEALAQGIPLVLVPIAGDQPYCASRCQALGAGRVIEPADRNATAIRAAVRTVLGDPSYRERARHMRDEIRALPPAAAAVAALEQIVGEHAEHRRAIQR
jgi:UDP:flavonoid glycosyltransferase YjiC (YdhE family)